MVVVLLWPVFFFNQIRRVIFHLPAFDLTIRDLYLTILVEVQKPYFRKQIFQGSYSVNRTQDYGLETCQ